MKCCLEIDQCLKSATDHPKTVLYWPRPPTLLSELRCNLLHIFILVVLVGVVLQGQFSIRFLHIADACISRQQPERERKRQAEPQPMLELTTSPT